MPSAKAATPSPGPTCWRRSTSSSTGSPDDWEYIQGEGHAVAIHEACHAVAFYRLSTRMTIDVATIERRGDTGGFVQPIPIEDRFSVWKSEREIDIMVYLASLAGERLFFDGDNTTGVGGDMGSATTIAMEMEGFHAMGQTLGSHRVTKMGIQGERVETGTDRMWLDSEFGRRVEFRLEELFARVSELAREGPHLGALPRARARSPQDGARRGHHRDHRRAPGPHDRRPRVPLAGVPGAARGVPRRRAPGAQGVRPRGDPAPGSPRPRAGAHRRGHAVRVTRRTATTSLRSSAARVSSGSRRDRTGSCSAPRPNRARNNRATATPPATRTDARAVAQSI